MPQWRKPSGRCSLHVDDQCVEVSDGLVPNQIAVRDSKNPDTSLIFTRPEFTAFANAVKAGEYDHLIDTPAGDFRNLCRVHSLPWHLLAEGGRPLGSAFRGDVRATAPFGDRDNGRLRTYPQRWSARVSEVWCPCGRP